MKHILKRILRMKNNQLRVMLVGLVVVFFASTLGHDFVYDDQAFIVKNSTAPTTQTIFKGTYPLANTGVYRPIRGLVYALAESVFLDSPVIYHGFVIALHAYITILIFNISLALIKSKKTALISGVIFALHPLHVESVAWVTAGFDLSFVIFYLLSFHFYTKQEHEHAKKWALLFGIFAYFSNELALTLPLILLIYDHIHHKKVPYMEKNISPYVFGALAYWFIRVNTIEGFAETARIYDGFVPNLLLSSVVFGKYILQMIFPNYLQTDPILYPGVSAQFTLNHNPVLPIPTITVTDTLPALLAILLMSILYFWLAAKKNTKNILVFFWWIPITLLPVMQIIPFINIYADRYGYLSSVGFSIIAGYLFSQLMQVRKYKTIVLIGLTLYVLFFGYKTISRNQEWKNEQAIWQSTYAQNPQSLAAINGLGYVYSEANDQETALKYFEQAYRLNPYVEKYQKNILISYRHFSMSEKTIEVIEQIQMQRKLDYSLQLMLGEAYETLGDTQNAQEAYAKAIQLSKNNQAAKTALQRVADQY